MLCDTTYCDAHRPHLWRNSTRKSRLPGNWGTLRKRILIRDRHSCYLCGAYAYRVDHIVAGDNHDPSNLAAICDDCDRTKSHAEGVEAKRRYGQHG